MKQIVWMQRIGTNKPLTGGFACQSLCGKRLRRPHFTCLYCRIRRVFYGKMSHKVTARRYRVLLSATKDEIRWYELLAVEGRRLQKIKDVLLDRLLSFCARHPTFPSRKRLFSLSECLAN